MSEVVYVVLDFDARIGKGQLLESHGCTNQHVSPV